MLSRSSSSMSMLGLADRNDASNIGQMLAQRNGVRQHVDPALEAARIGADKIAAHPLHLLEDDVGHARPGCGPAG